MSLSDELDRQLAAEQVALHVATVRALRKQLEREEIRSADLSSAVSYLKSVGSPREVRLAGSSADEMERWLEERKKLQGKGGPKPKNDDS